MKKITLALITLLMSICSWAQTINYYVSTDAGSNQTGTIEQPFATISQALETLGKIQTADRIVIYLEDGIYTENIVILPDLFLESPLPLFFRSVSEKPENCLIQKSPSINEPIVNIGYVDSVIFQNITFKAVETNAVECSDYHSLIEFHGCIFDLSEAVDYVAIKNNGHFGNIYVNNSSFIDGEAVVFLGNEGSEIIIDSCIFENASLSVDSGKITANNSVFKYEAIENPIALSNSSGTFNSNKFSYKATDTDTLVNGFGSSLYYTNNVIYTENAAAIVTQEMEICVLDYNTIYSKNASAISTSSGVSQKPLFLHNNILVSDNKPIINDAAGAFTNSDYNVFFTDTTPFIQSGKELTFEEWKAQELDLNSYFLNPYFISDSDLTPQNIRIDNKGSYNDGYPTDINGVVRTQISADPGAIQFDPYLSGTYFVSDTSEFSTITEATQAVGIRGIKDSVEFRLMPNVYNEQLIIPNEIYSTSELYKIAFTSSTGNPNDVVITPPSGAAFTAKLNSFVTLDNLKIVAPADSSQVAILLPEYFNYVTVQNCVIESATDVASKNALIVNKAPTDLSPSNLVIANNEFNAKGQLFIDINGTEVGGSEPYTISVGNIYIRDNYFSAATLSDSSSYINIDFAEEVYITGNTFRNEGTESITVEMSFCEVGSVSFLQFNGNKINSYGNVKFSGLQSTNEIRTLNFYNNAIDITGEPINIGSCGGYNILHNTIRSTTTSACIRIPFSEVGGRIWNNIMYGNYSPFYNLSVSSQRNGNIYSYQGEGSEKIIDTLSLADIQKSEDEISSMARTIYFETGSLKPAYYNELGIDGAGVDISSIVSSFPDLEKDLAGTTRNITTPDIGAYEFTAIRQPQIELPSGQTICDGDTASIDAGDTFGAPVLWFNNRTLLPSDTLPVLKATQPGDYQVKVIWGNDTIESNLYTLKVNPAPIISLAYDSVLLCSTDSLLLQAGDITDLATTYQWSNGVTDGSYVYSTPNTYYVTATNMYECMAYDSLRVDEQQAFELSIVSSDPSCGIANGDIIISPDIQSDNYTFNWSGDTLTGRELTNLSAGTYYVTVTDSVCFQSDSIILAEPKQPSVVFSGRTWVQETDQMVPITDSDSLKICIGNSIEFVNLGRTILGELTWVADPPVDGFDGSTHKPTETTIYTAILTSGECQAVDSFVAVVNKKPEILTPDSVMKVCEGTPAEFIPEVENTIAYDWYLNDSLVSDSSLLSTDFVSIEDEGIYSLTAINECGSVTSDSILNLTVVPMPEPFAGNDTIVCEGDSVQLIPSGGEHYFWYYEDGDFVWTAGDDDIFYTPDSSSIVRLKAINGSLCYLYDTIQITLAPLPSVQLEDTVAMFIGSDVTITAPQGFKQYSWSSGSTDSLLSVTAQGMYKLTITDDNGCKAIDSVYVKEKSALNILRDSLKLGKGRSFTFSIDAAVAVEWTADGSIARIDQNGRVTAISEGTAWVFAKNAEYGLTDSVKIIVPADYVSVGMIVLPATKGVYVGDSFKFSTTIIPADATMAEIKWHSTDTTVATVDQNGNVKALSAGVCNIVATSLDTYEPTICVLGVSQSTIKPVALHVEDSVFLLPNKQYKLGGYVEPLSAQQVKINYASLNPAIASVDADGVVTTWKEGVAQIVANVSNSSLTAKSYIFVEANQAPQLIRPLDVTISKELGMNKLNLSDYFSDDFTSFDNLSFEFDAPAEINFMLNGDELTIEDKSGEYLGGLTFSIIVSDSLGKSNTYEFDLNLSDEENTSPQIFIDKLSVKAMSDSTSVQLQHFVCDDFTLPENIEWGIETDDSLLVTLENKLLKVKAKYADSYVTDTVKLAATDEHGKTYTKAVIFSNIPQSNEAPFIMPIAEQVEINGGFIPLNLNNYAIDDYTAANNIIWNFVPSDKIKALIKNNMLYLSVADKFWYGSAPLTLMAMDEDGATSFIDVIVNRKNSDMDYWNGNPLSEIQASKMLTTPISPVQFFADMRGVDSWQWEFEGGSPAVSHALMPSVLFPEKGSYSVKLKTMNFEGDSVYEKMIYMDGKVEVVGIEPRYVRLCQNDDSVTLKVDAGLDELMWSNGETADSITVKPSASRYYSIQFNYGYQIVTDSVMIELAPIAKLGADTAICANTSLELDPGAFFAYSWSDGSTEPTMEVSDSGQYSVAVMDEYLCASYDTITITEILGLPQVDLGENDSLCAGVELTLDAGEFIAYEWSTGETAQTTTVDTTGDYSVTVTNAEGCKAADTVSVFYQYPYAEPLGIATFSENGSAIVLAWERTEGKMTEKYELYRESGGLNKYVKIAERAYFDSLYYIDTDANSVQQSYKYKLVTTDSICGNQAESAPHRTIHLSQNRGLMNNMVNLSWTSYEGLEVEEYIIYKIENGKEDEEIGRVIPGNGNVFSYSFHSEDFRYRVGFKLDHEIRLSRLKTDSGPYSHSISNIAEIELTAVNKETVGLEICPVPVINTLRVSVDLLSECSYGLFTSSNQLLQSGIFNKQTEIDMCALPAGIYVLNVSTEQGVISCMLVKK